MSRAVRHIAVIRFSAMGDVAMAVPVLDSVARQHDVRITMVSRPFFAPLFSGIPNVTFFAADLTSEYKGFWGLVRLYRDLRKLEVDAVADLHDVLRSKVVRVLFAISGIRTASIDKGRKEKKALTRLRDKVFRQLRHSTDRYADVFAQLGFAVDITTYKPAMHPLKDEVVSAIGNKSEKWIGIAPFAQHQGKVYPTDLIQQVVDRLSQLPYKILLFGGGKDEIRKLETLSGHRQNVMVVAGKFSFPHELNILANLDVMLSMDSANAHLAANFGVPVITLWGATHPYAGFAPFGQHPANALTADREKFPGLPTSVYGNKLVPGYEDVMRTISPGDVVARIRLVLDQTSS